MAMGGFGAKVPKGRKLKKRFKDRRDFDEGVPMPSRKKSKEQEYRDAVAAGVLFDAVDTDKEEGRMRKINRKTSSTTFDPKTRKKRRGKTKAKMGGGKIYASMDKKYGGGIYPKMGK